MLFALTCRTITSSNNVKGKYFPRYWPSMLCLEFTGQRWIPLTNASASVLIDVFFDLRLNKRLSKQSIRWWFETPSRSLCHCSGVYLGYPTSVWVTLSILWKALYPSISKSDVWDSPTNHRLIHQSTSARYEGHCLSLWRISAIGVMSEYKLCRWTLKKCSARQL